MSDDAGVSQEQARALAELAGLELSPERLASLTSMLAAYRRGAAKLRAIDLHTDVPPIPTTTLETPA